MASDTRRSEIVSGLFVLAALLLFLVLVFRIGGIDAGRWFGRLGVPGRVILDDVKTLAVGAKVVVGGREVGAVTGMEFVDAAADAAAGSRSIGIGVDFELHDPNLRVDWSTAAVELVQDGFLGRHHLRLDPGRWTAAAAPATLAESAARSAAGDGIERQQVQRRGGDALERLLSSLPPVLDRVEQILRKIDERVLSDENIDRIGRAFADLEETVAQLRGAFEDDSQDGLRARVLGPLHEILVGARDAVAAARAHLVEQTLPRADSLLEEGSAALRDVRGEAARLGEAVGRLAPRADAALAALERALRAAEEQVQSVGGEARGLLGAGRGLVQENRAEVAESLRRLRRTMWEAELLVRKLRANPSYLLFGDDEIDYRVEPRDASGLLRSGRAAPFGQRDEGSAGGGG